MGTETTRLEREAAALGLTGETDVLTKLPPTRIGRTSNAVLAGGCCVLAVLSAAASIWLVFPVLVASALLVHVLNNRNAREELSGDGKEISIENDFDPLAENGRAFRRLRNLTSELSTNPIYRNLPGNLSHHRRHGLSRR